MTMTTTPPVQPALGVNQEAARQAEFLSVRTLAASPQRERRPWAEAPSTGSSASHQAAESTSESTAERAIGALIARDGVIADYLGPKIAQCESRGPIPQLGTAEWEHLDDGDPRKVGAVFVAAREWTVITSLRRWTVLDAPRQAEAERLTIQRQASHAIADAIDWGKQAARPSHAELVRRRSVIT